MCIYMHYIMLLFENVVFLLLAEWVTPVSIIISLIAGVLLLLTSTLVIICVWKRIKALHNVNDGGDHIPRAFAYHPVEQILDIQLQYSYLKWVFEMRSSEGLL